jgi:hypothetical protein
MKNISFTSFCEALRAHNIFAYFSVAFLCCFSSATIAQTFPSSCTSKDLSLVSAVLTGGDPCNSCTPGQTLTRNLVLGINNKTGSTRTAFAFWATLEITHANGTVVTTAINRCSGPIPPTGPLPAFYSGGTFGTITYQCGDALRLLDLHLAWTDASPNSTCPINSATINPKCGVLPAIVINAGVNGAFNITNSTCTANGSIAVSPTGGTPPFKVVIGAVTHNPVAAGATTTFTNLAAATYTVVITDANNCVISFSKTIGSPTALGVPAATPTQPTCTVATGSCSVTSPVAGITYTLRQGGTIMHTANASGLFSSVPTGTYALVAALGTCSTNGNNVTINSQPATPSAPEVCIVQPSLCGPATGSVTITSPVGAGYEYSINNGSTWQASPVFSNVAAGSVTGIKAKKDGCISDSATCSDSDCSVSRTVEVIDEPQKVLPVSAESNTVGFDLYPVPFKDQLAIRYKFDYKTDVKIEVFNSVGMLIMTKHDNDARLDKEMTMNMNFGANDFLYFVRVTTNRGTAVRTVVSTK